MPRRHIADIRDEAGGQLLEPSGSHQSHRRFPIVAVCLVLVAVGGWAIWRATRSTLPAASCGTTATHNLGGVTQILGEFHPGTLGCFATAARKCNAASIEVTEMGVDAGIRYVFVIRSGGPPCVISELSQSYGYTGQSIGPIISVPCRVTAMTGSGVMLSCARLAVLIPAAVTAPGVRPAGLPAASCGEQFSARKVDSIQALSGTEPRVLACFSKAARTCRSASIGMRVSPGHGTGTNYVFRIERGRAPCQVTEVRQAWGINGAGWWSGIVHTVPCHLRTLTSSRLRLTCGRQDISIPGDI